jgi:hypothetical protein
MSSMYNLGRVILLFGVAGKEEMYFAALEGRKFRYWLK